MCVCVYVDVYIYANYIYNYDKSILNNHSPGPRLTSGVQQTLTETFCNVSLPRDLLQANTLLKYKLAMHSHVITSLYEKYKKYTKILQVVNKVWTQLAFTTVSQL